jgi:hypothetical protein
MSDILKCPFCNEFVKLKGKFFYCDDEFWGNLSVAAYERCFFSLMIELDASHRFQVTSYFTGNKTRFYLVTKEIYNRSKDILTLDRFINVNEAFKRLISLKDMLTFA